MKEHKNNLRMCIACHEMKHKSELVRIVKNSQGQIMLDETIKADGRGAYVCQDIDCINKCIKARQLNRAFKCNVDQAIYKSLIEDFKECKKIK